MPKSIHNSDLEQGRYGHFAIRAGTATAVIPDGYVIGGFLCTTAGALSTATYAGAGTATGITGLATIPAGVYIPGRFSAMVGNGTIEGIAFFEPV